MFIVLVIFHVIICVSLILVVLMQASKGEGLAGGTAFGGGMSNAVFGGRGAASFLSRATTVLAVVFMLNSGALALMSARRPVAANAGQNAPQTTTSAVTRQAQEAAAQAAQQRQAQQNLDSLGLLQDTTGTIQIQPGEAVKKSSDK